MKKSILGLSLILTFVVSASQAFGYSKSLDLGKSLIEDVGASVRIGTLGGSIEVNKPINKYLGARAGFNYFTYGTSEKLEDVSYDIDLEFKSFGAYLDWYPFNSTIHFTAGVLINGNKIEADGKAQSSYRVGNNSFTGAEVGTLDAEVDFNALAPYFGVGVDTSWGGESQVSFNLDLGIIYQGAPDVNITASGTAASDPFFQSNLAKEISDFEDDMSFFKWYPVVSVGLGYRW
mgnify:CR=1 FL=1